MTRWAVLSDIHGNLPALEAVLADARDAGATAFLNLGDILAGPLWPRETATRLMAMPMPTIAGNHERQMLTAGSGALGPSDRFAAERITEAQRRWLATLPRTMQPAGQLLMIHGTPASDLEYLLETVTPDYGLNGSSGVRAATAEEIRARMPPVAATLVLCGHTHMPREVVVDGLRIANPGSVGLPAFDWDRPHPHDMETGSPQARYALVEAAGTDWQVTLRGVDYDCEAAARRAEAGGRGDWADALRSGRVGRREDDLR